MLLKILMLLGVLLLLARLYGASRWRAASAILQQDLRAARLELPVAYDPADLNHLPAPVQRYFHTVLKNGQPLISKATLEHSGTFDMGSSSPNWKPFSSTQLVVTRRPGFVWDARIRIAPLLTVFVHDAYAAGKPVLLAKLFGLLTLMQAPQSPQLAQAELMRFLAEAAWYPTALLPFQGLTWDAIDATHALATLTDGSTQVGLVFEFDDQNLIRTVRSEGRYRMANGAHVPTPWQGRFWAYEQRDGLLIPTRGEVSWILPEGPKPYWRGKLSRIDYQYRR